MSPIPVHLLTAVQIFCKGLVAGVCKFFYRWFARFSVNGLQGLVSICSLQGLMYIVFKMRWQQVASFDVNGLQIFVATVHKFWSQWFARSGGNGWQRFAKDQNALQA